MMIDMEEADLVIIALENHDEGVNKLQSLHSQPFGNNKDSLYSLPLEDILLACRLLHEVSLCCSMIVLAQHSNLSGHALVFNGLILRRQITLERK